jgi:pyruvate dehydrogenase E1 component alpha subunit
MLMGMRQRAATPTQLQSDPMKAAIQPAYSMPTSIAEKPMATEWSKERLLYAYRVMKTIREFEERLHAEFASGEIPGFVHLYAGEEASAAGVCMHLNDDDVIASTHRGHGHCIAKGMGLKAMMAEIWGKRTGVCHGKGGSMHVADLSIGMMGANGIVGGGGPLICGAALAAKLKRHHGVGVCFFGDGASNQGTIFEALNLAKVWELPAVFVAENNGYAEATSSTWSVACDNIADRAGAFGMPGMTVDGADFFAVYDAAGEAVRRARQGHGPSLLEVKFLRYFGHFEGDQQTYRAADEVRKSRETKDCLTHFAAQAIAGGKIARAELDRIDKEVLALVDDAVRSAKSDPKPTEADLLTDVYASY